MYHSRTPSSYPEAIGSTSKFRQKVNICGGISYKGPTSFKVTLYRIIIYKVNKNFTNLRFNLDISAEYG